MNSTSKPTIVPGDITNDAPAESGMLARLARRALLERLGRLQDGEIRLQDAQGAQRFGARTARCGLSATISVRDPEFYSLAAFGGTVGAGESYINGHWQCDDLTALVRIMVQNRDVMEGLESGVRRHHRATGAPRAALGQPQQPQWQRAQHCRALRPGQ